MTSDCPEKGSFCHPLRAPADEQPLLGAGDNNRKRSQPMRRLKTIALATATLSVLTLGTMTAHAADGDMSRQLTEARQEGSVWTAFALNRHLSPFSIDVEVENGVAILTGEVESEVERDLAAQVALGVEGINEVDNQDRKSTRLNSSHVRISYAVFCLKKKKKTKR